MTGRVENKIALVTGGSKGLGKAVAELLAEEGATVYVTDVDETEGVRTVDAMEQHGRDVYFLRHNTADEGDWKRVFEEIRDRYGRLDIMVNNAGIGVFQSVESASLEDWRKLLSVNLDGVFLGTRYAIELMKAQGRGGSIINLSSIEGLVGDPNLAAYCASKGGVRLFSKSAALDVAKLGIRVNTVHPGYIETPMVLNACKALEPHCEDARQTEAYQRLVGQHPVGHLGEPADIAYGVLYLASDESKFVTGSELVIDGGYTAQ